MDYTSSGQANLAMALNSSCMNPQTFNSDTTVIRPPFIPEWVWALVLLGIITIPIAISLVRGGEKEKDDCEPNCVVRGGLAAPNNLMDGYGPVRQSPLHGFSVQYSPGVPLTLLASVGLRNLQLSYARDTELIAAGVAVGYGITIIPTPQGFGAYHSTLSAYSGEGNILEDLPEELAVALSAAFFRKMPNPNRG